MFANLVRLIREWKRYNQSLSELSRLGDRELADIGISRSDIHRVALERRASPLNSIGLPWKTPALAAGVFICAMQKNAGRLPRPPPPPRFRP